MIKYLYKQKKKKRRKQKRRKFNIKYAKRNPRYQFYLNKSLKRIIYNLL